MEVPGKPRRPSRLRLFVLLTIALIGYEYALYRHWLTSVPLLPTTTLELPPDRAPIGFTPDGEFIVGRKFGRLSETNGVTIGPIEYRSFPAGSRIAERLGPGDRIVGTLPLSSMPLFDDYQPSFFSPFPGNGLAIIYERGGPAQKSIGSPRASTFYCIDRDHFLCLEEGTLQSYDPNTDRVRWTLSRVHSVVSIGGDSAYVMRLPDETPTGKRQTSSVIVSLSDGSCDERPFPEEVSFELTDMSPDGRFIVYRLDNAFEVWSLEQQSRLWRKTTSELGTRQLMFSDDGESLLNCTLDEDGSFQRLAFRSSDGERLPTRHDPANPGASVIPAIKTSGSRFALFQTPSSRNHESEFALWLQRLAMRVGVFMPPAAHPRNATVFDTVRGQPLGIVDLAQDPRLLTASDGKGFALCRSSSPPVVQLYTLPPRRNWLWWSIRAIGLPLFIVVLAMAAIRYRRRRCFKEVDLSMAGSRERTESYAGG